MATSIRLGDVEVPRIGIGSNRLSYSDDHVSFIREVVDLGIRHIDSAYLYAGGDSERTIGAALSPVPDDVVVATKGGYGEGEGRPEVLRAQIDESLRRLGVDCIDLYYLHRVHGDTPVEDSMGAIKEAQEAGKVRHVGISEVGVDQVERARSVVDIVAVQNHYNLAERKWEAVVDYCEREGIVFVPYFPLRGDVPRALGEIAARHGATESQAALAWLLRRSPVMLPIPGTLNPTHAKENVAALEIELSEEEFAALQ